MDRRGALATLAGLAGCATAEVTSPDPPSTVPAVERPADAGFTHVRPGGNRYAEASGDLRRADPVDVPVGATPAWVIAVPAPDGPRFAAVTEDGATSAFALEGREPVSVTVAPDRLPTGLPPVGVVADGTVRLLRAPAAEASDASPPFPAGAGLVYTTMSGELVLYRDGERDRLSLGAPVDARVVGAGAGRVAVLGDATERYPHGALGDTVEAGSLLVVEVGDGLAVRDRHAVEGVIEGVAALTADVTGDRPRELVVTESGARGAAVVARGDGETLRGPPVGDRFRWRHQLAVAPFAPDGIPELAAIRTPHIGGVAEFYRAGAGGLEVAATVAGGYRSHEFGSRNLDGGTAADVDGDGRPELVVPTRDRQSLAALERTADGASEAWRLPVGGRLSTNLVAAGAGNGLALAAGHPGSGGSVRVWTTRA